MDTVFISHSKIDERHGKEIEDLIRDGGYRGWRFQRDMQGGRPWQQQLPEEIEKCNIFLYIATANAQNSVNCQKEVQHAALKKKPLVTVTVEAGVIPSPPLDDHQRIHLDGSGNAVARLMLALRSAEPLRWPTIPEDWKTWDGQTKKQLTKILANNQGASSPRSRRELTVVEKHDILHSAIAEFRTYFESALQELARPDSRIESRFRHDCGSGFTCYIYLAEQLIRGCRIYISAGYNGITYDGNTYSALQWEIEEFKRQMKDANRRIEENLQAVVDGDEDAAALVRNLHAQFATSRDQKQNIETVLNELRHRTGSQEDNNSYIIQATIAKLNGEPVLEILPSPSMTIEMPDSQICTIAVAAQTLSRAFICDLSN